MPSGPVQLQPLGFLGLLQLKNKGRNPLNLDDNYVPSLDLLQWLQETAALTAVGERTLAASTTFPGGYLDFSPAITVPSTEWWYVSNYTVRAVQLAGDGAYSVQPGVRWDVRTDPPGAFGVLGNSGPDRNLGNATINFPFVSWGWTQGPCWIPPGATLGVAYGVAITDAGTILLNGYVRYTPLPI